MSQDSVAKRQLRFVMTSHNEDDISGETPAAEYHLGEDASSCCTWSPRKQLGRRKSKSGKRGRDQETGEGKVELIESGKRRRSKIRLDGHPVLFVLRGENDFADTPHTTNEEKGVLPQTPLEQTPLSCENSVEPKEKSMDSRVMLPASRKSIARGSCKDIQKEANVFSKESFLQPSDVLLSPLDIAPPAQVRLHLKMLRMEALIKPLLAILNRLLLHPLNRSTFNVPVDPVTLNIPDYFDIIKHPLDLGTIKQRLLKPSYESVESFADDVRVVFKNAMEYNPVGHHVYMAAFTMLKDFEKDFSNLLSREVGRKEKINLHSCEMCGGHTCLLCGDKCLLFECSSLYCVGKCGDKIKRGATYYTSEDRKSVWCQKCYNACGKTTPPLNEDSSGHPVPKSSLHRRKFDDQVTEPWVQCDKCEKWVHQVCALFNERENALASRDVFYTCPACRLEEEENTGDTGVKSSRSLQPDRSSSSLPETSLSRHLQSAVRQLVSSTENNEVAATITIRIVGSSERVLTVPQAVRDHFCLNGVLYPRSMIYKSKTIMVFQKIDGVDVAIFCMFVHEFDDTCPPPYTGAVYIAYLDSVGYLRPRALRTQVYQQVLISYFEHCKLRGFRTAHIWACPPARGDDFIFWCHPAHQKCPSKDRLAHWYQEVITKAVALGAVHSSTTMFERYFVVTSDTDSNALKCSMIEPPPVFDGDFFPLEVERLLATPLHKRKKFSQKKHDNTLASKKIVRPINTPEGIDDTAAALNEQVCDVESQWIKQAFGFSALCSKESLLVVDLVPRCLRCGFHFSGTSHASSRGQGLPETGETYCQNCALPQLEGLEMLHETAKIDETDFSLHCELLSKRDTFLHTCEFRHNQFDSLRRAKHSTMMLLHYLHRPDTAPFRDCALCKDTILTGIRWTCKICMDYNVCAACLTKESHVHPLTPLDVEAS